LNEIWQVDGFIGLTGTYIEGIFVSIGARSRGIGKQLLTHVKCLKSRLSLHVYKKNTRAIHFYEREHFQVQSEEIDENTGEGEYVMIWQREE
jgi:putative acetyltransferase